MDDLRPKPTVEDFLSPGTKDPAEYRYGKTIRVTVRGGRVVDVECLGSLPGRVFRRGGQNARAGNIVEVDRG